MYYVLMWNIHYRIRPLLTYTESSFYWKLYGVGSQCGLLGCYLLESW